MAGPGWYADPDGVWGQLRWWDGGGWTAHVTGDPSGEPPADGPGPPSGLARGAPSAWTRALIPTGAPFIVLASLVLTVASALVVATEAAAQGAIAGHTHLAGHLLRMALAPDITSGVMLLGAAAVLKAVRATAVTGGTGGFRVVCVVAGTIVAIISIVGCAVSVADIAAGGVLAPVGGWAGASVALDRVASFVPAAAAMWLLAGEHVERFAANASIQLEEEPGRSPARQRRVNQPRPRPGQGHGDPS